MLKGIRLGVKLGLGFAAVTFLALVVGVSAYVIIQKLNHESILTLKINAVEVACLEARRQEKNYVIRKGEEDFKLWLKSIEALQSGIEETSGVAREDATRTLLAEATRGTQEYKKLAENLRTITANASALDDKMRDGAREVETYLKGMSDSTSAIVSLLNARRQEKNAILYQDIKLHEGEKTYRQKWYDEMKGVNEWPGADEGLKSLAGKYADLFTERIKLIEQSKMVDEDMIVRARSILTAVETILKDATGSMNHLESTATRVILIVLGICILAAAGLAYFLTRGITDPIHRIIASMKEGSTGIAAASNQISSSSQSLAEGASEQAAAIEETSSSMEEMSAMTRQNANHAGQADTLMKTAEEIMSRTRHSMEELTASMAEIVKANEDTSRIIKTIDEIAFQTNLLALNAAVEAARAGDAGLGFAVVADEVRNLALRASDAAKNTAFLIEGTSQKVKDGSDQVARTRTGFLDMTESAMRVSRLVGEIAAASTEQAQGLEQINKAVAEMDKVVQQNASNAEESASASEEMNAMAQQMKDIVTELLLLVMGTQTPPVASHVRYSKQARHGLNRLVLENWKMA